MPLAFAPGRSRRLLEGSPLIRAGWVLRGYPGFRTAAGQAVSAPFALPKAVPANRNRLWRRKAGIRGEKPLYPAPRKAGEPGVQACRLFHSQEGTGTYGPFSPAQGKLPPTSMRFHWRGKSAAASRMTGAGPMMTPKRRGNAHPPTVSRLRERGMGGDPMPIRNASPRQRTDGKRKLSFACLCCKNCILWIFCCLFSGDLLQ